MAEAKARAEVKAEAEAAAEAEAEVEVEAEAEGGAKVRTEHGTETEAEAGAGCATGRWPSSMGRPAPLTAPRLRARWDRTHRPSESTDSILYSAHDSARRAAVRGTLRDLSCETRSSPLGRDLARVRLGGSIISIIPHGTKHKNVERSLFYLQVYNLNKQV